LYPIRNSPESNIIEKHFLEDAAMASYLEHAKITVQGIVEYLSGNPARPNLYA
jgi:hypothetical protein